MRPLPPEAWHDDIAPLRNGFAGQLNVYRTMAHHPDLLNAWAPLRAHIVQNSALGPERLEVVTLRIATRLESSYEWTHHLARADRLGMSHNRIHGISGPIEGMSDDDGLLARCVDALIDNTQLDADLLSKLTAAVGTPGVLDLMTTVGFYQVLACIAETTNLPTDDCE